MNKKQLLYSENRIRLAENKIKFKFMITVLAIFAACMVVDYITSPSADKFDIYAQIGTGISYATMAAVGNIPYLSDRETSPNQIAYKVWLVEVHQVDPDVTYPSPNGSGEVGTIPLLTGEYWHYFEAIDNTVEDKTTGTKGEVTTDVTNTFAFIMGGNTTSLMKFIRDHAGGKFIIVYKDVSDNAYRILGNIDKPMVLQSYERKNDKEGKYIPFTFQNKWFDMQWTYTGNLTTTTPETIAANATELAVTSNPTYQLTSGTASAATIATVSGLASADVGRVIDIIGSGGAYPSLIADNTVFILTDSGTWTANAGSRISFKILGTGTLVEVLGSRVQTA
jgi:hypothetical protein